MDGTALPPGDALPVAPGPSTLPGAVIGLASRGVAPDSVPSMNLAADAVQRAARVPLPPGAVDAYAPGTAAFMMGAAMPQRRMAPVIGMDFTQMPKVGDVVSPTHLGMLAFPAVAKTPPKQMAPRQTPDNAVTPDALAGRVEETQGRMPHTPPSGCDGMVTSPGGLAGRRGCGSGGSSTVSSSASGPAGRCGAPARGNISALASRSNANRKVSTPVSRPAAPTPGDISLAATISTDHRLGEFCFISLQVQPMNDPFKLCFVYRLRLLSIAPPLYSTAAPIAASSRKKQAMSESLRRETTASPLSSSSPEPREYCINNSGEQFLPLLFQDCCGADECVPPDELLQFEEDALREIASHIEAKLTHALTCMLLSAKTRARLAARKRSRPLPASSPEEEKDKSVAALEPPTGSDDSRNGEKRQARGNDADSTTSTSQEDAFQRNCNMTSEPFGASGDAQRQNLLAPIPEVGAEEWGPPALNETPASSNSGGAICISLEDLVATYGPAPRLMRHEHCFQQDSDFRQITM
ncbi:hypothetical protein Emag_002977 [Eimeria magna]